MAISNKQAIEYVGALRDHVRASADRERAQGKLLLASGRPNLADDHEVTACALLVEVVALDTVLELAHRALRQGDPQ